MAVPLIKIVEADESVDDDLNFPLITKEFLLAGCAYFLVVNPVGLRFAYAIRQRGGKRGSKFQGSIVYWLRVFRAGTYAYVGKVDPETGIVTATGRSEFVQGTMEFDVAQWAVSTVFNGLPIKPGYRITHNEKCAACGRVLVERGDRETGFHLDCTNDD